MKILYNPYSDVDWQSSPRVKAVSHEHAYSDRSIARMYDRGIRFFCHVHYQPAAIRVPLSDIDSSFEDWNYFDASYVMGKNYATTSEARKDVPDILSNVICNFKQEGLIVAYKDSNAVQKWTILKRDVADGETWTECCDDSSAWDETDDEEVMTSRLSRHIRTLKYSIPTFQSQASADYYEGSIPAIAFAGDGLLHYTDDIPQIPNAEHVLFRPIRHFNVLGTLNGEAGWSVGATNGFRYTHPLYGDKTDGADYIGDVFPTSSSFYDGKLFGTQNHDNSVSQFEKLQDMYPWFKGFEIYNNDSTRYPTEANPRESFEGFIDSFHKILNDGYTAYCLAVCDWQDDYRGASDVDGGTNVLYLPNNYDSLSVADKSKAGMDSYINGKFVASRFGSRYVTDFSVDAETKIATFKVSETATRISILFNGVAESLENSSEISVKIPDGTTNITGEAWFGDNGEIWKSEDKLADSTDFIFTQAIIVDTMKKKTFMDEKMMMFALDAG